MPGPTPKKPNLRQRRNKDATSASLIDSSPLIEGQIPELRERVDDDGTPIEWHPRAVRYWKDIWTSPMASEYTQADVEGLEILMDLVDRYWRKPSTTLAGEMRLQRQCYGLTPIDRRRLQWEIKRIDPDAPAAGPKREKRPARAADPRAVIKAVS